jgi:phosphate uptake regulator
MSEKRKIQLTGGSTYIVSLPITWVRQNGLSPGDTVSLSVRSDRSLTVTADIPAVEKMCRSVIEIYLSGDQEDDFRMLVSNYLVGYDIMKIISPTGFTASDRKFMRDAARKRLIGIEIVEETGTELVLQSLLNYQEITILKSMSSMDRIISSMLEDALISLEEHDLELAKDVIQRDDDVDRFYLLTVRQLRAALDDSFMAQKIGIVRSKDCLGYRIVTKSMEHIGDHVQRIATNVLEMDCPVGRNDEIFRLGRVAQALFRDSVEAMSGKDPQFANTIIKNSKKLSNMAALICSRECGQDSSTGEHKRNILESLQSIAEYSADIAEVSINMGSKEPKDMPL